MPEIRAYIGGSFNPIHLGHIQLAKETLAFLRIDQVTLIPCKDNHLKTIDSTISTEKRKKLLNQAVQEYPFLHVDYRELNSPNAHSYTAQTLQSIHQQYPQDTIVFVMGSDTFYGIYLWKQWQSILQYCHLLVFNRLGYEPPQTVPESLLQCLDHYAVSEKVFSHHLSKTPQETRICLMDMQHPINISSTHIRSNGLPLP